MECLLCGVSGIRQPTIKTKVVAGYYIPLRQGGAKTQRNMFSCCKFHKKLYEDWATPDERKIARELLFDHFRRCYPDWNFTQCMEEKNEDDRV